MKIDVFFLSSESSGKSKAFISAAGTDRQTQRYKMSAIIIEASYASTCPFSGEKIKPGDAICQYTIQQHKAYMRTEGKGPVALREALIGRWGKREYVDFSAQTTRYGRRVRRPARLGTRQFVKGSRTSEPDQYDRSYNRGVSYDAEPADAEPTEADEAFLTCESDGDASEEDCGEESEEELSDIDESDEEEDYSECEDNDEESEDEYGHRNNFVTDDGGTDSDCSSLTDYERPFKWAWEEDDEEEGELHKPDSERDDMFCDVDPSEELMFKGQRFIWPGVAGCHNITKGGVRKVTLRNGREFTVLEDSSLVLDEDMVCVGELYMDHLGVYNIHTGEGPCDG